LNGKKKIDAIGKRDFLSTIWLTKFFNFCPCAEILIFTVFSPIFGARKKKISASDRIIPCQDFLYLPDF